MHLQFRRVNIMLGNLKASLAGICHVFDFSNYATRYPAEFRYRFKRRFDLASMLP